jgi:glucose-6-phosphate 1-dehydrogenase
VLRGRGCGRRRAGGQGRRDGGRGRFYDSVGALRDVVQNHLLQVLALVAMDPPVGASAGDTQDKKAEVLRGHPRWQQPWLSEKG